MHGKVPEAKERCHRQGRHSHCCVGNWALESLPMLEALALIGHRIFRVEEVYVCMSASLADSSL